MSDTHSNIFEFGIFQFWYNFLSQFGLAAATASVCTYPQVPILIRNIIPRQPVSRKDMASGLRSHSDHTHVLCQQNHIGYHIIFLAVDNHLLATKILFSDLDSEFVYIV